MVYIYVIFKNKKKHKFVVCFFFLSKSITNNNHNLNKEELMKIETLIKTFRELDQNSDPLSRIREVVAEYDVPIDQPLYRASPKERKNIKPQID
jgi:hypothetical protein